MTFIRKARKDDIVSVVKLLADDHLGQTREDFRLPLPPKYLQAFNAIDQDRNQELLVVENSNGMIVGTMQLSFIQYLTYQGGIRAQIEAVRIHKDERGQGLGERMINWAIDKAREKGCHVIQLTSDKKRPKAIKFYHSLGFRATHEGMKLHL